MSSFQDMIYYDSIIGVFRNFFCEWQLVPLCLIFKRFFVCVISLKMSSMECTKLHSFPIGQFCLPDGSHEHCLLDVLNGLIVGHMT